MATQEQDRAKIAGMRLRLIEWYMRNRRDLPWRKRQDPYAIWVSEIMLQQTRVAVVVERYQAFMARFPSLVSLALASEQEVLALWSGLGYYRRARMLHKSARFVADHYQGNLPVSSAELRALPGIGAYTAAAIASIAHGEPVAVVDGNVERVLCRLDGLPRDDGSAWQREQELLDRRHPGDWNQAMMELGATVCTPQNPQCLVCPVREWCRAPGAETSKPQATRKRVRIFQAMIARSERIYLVQRPAEAAKMAGMWELPEVADSKAGLGAEELCRVRHSITDTDYEVRVLSLPLKALGAEEKKAGRWVERAQLWTLPLTGLARKILHKQGLY